MAERGTMKNYLNKQETAGKSEQRGWGPNEGLRPLLTTSPEPPGEQHGVKER